MNTHQTYRFPRLSCCWYCQRHIVSALVAWLGRSLDRSWCLRHLDRLAYIGPGLRGSPQYKRHTSGLSTPQSIGSKAHIPETTRVRSHRCSQKLSSNQWEEFIRGAVERTRSDSAAVDAEWNIRFLEVFELSRKECQMKMDLTLTSGSCSMKLTSTST